MRFFCGTMLAVAIVIIIAEATSSSSSSPSNTSKSCNNHYCYHLIEVHSSSVFRRYLPTWGNLTNLVEFCPTNISRDSWLLEVYDRDEQHFVEQFLRNHTKDKNNFRWEFPILVPLNLKVSYLGGWYWLDGREANNIDTNISGNHYAYMDFKMSNITFTASSSNLPDHQAICHISRRHCKELRSSFLYNDHCIYHIKRRLTWHEARMDCHSKKGELTSVTPDLSRSFHRVRQFRRQRRVLLPEQSRRYDYIASYWKDIWVGLRNVDEIWLKKNSSAIYTNWGGDAIHPFKFGYEFAFLETDSGKWSVAVPDSFEMKIICMTENKKNNTKRHDDEMTTCSSTSNNDQCQVTTTWLIIVILLLFLVALVIGILFARDRFKSDIVVRMKHRGDDCTILHPFDDVQPQQLYQPNEFDVFTYHNGATSKIN